VGFLLLGRPCFNAFKRAQAKRIEVELRYDERQFRSGIRDERKGIEPTLLSEGGHPGHYGLGGMRRTRTDCLLATSRCGAGTIPARMAQLRIPAS
jgi:nitrate/nitrite-specific signal transduction histidine kinase